MKKQKNINIPEYLKDFSPEGATAAVRRRMENATPRKPWRFAMLCVVVAVASFLSGVSIMHASQKMPEEPQQPIMVIHDRAAWELNDQDAALVCAAVAGVARGEAQLAKEAVAQVIRDTAKEISVAEAIEIARLPMAPDDVTEEVVQAVSRIAEGYNAIDESITYCYNPAVQDGTWHESQQFVAQIGNIRFFRSAN